MAQIQFAFITFCMTWIFSPTELGPGPGPGPMEKGTIFKKGKMKIQLVQNQIFLYYTFFLINN